MLWRSIIIYTGLFLLLIVPSTWGEDSPAEKWVLDCAAIDLTAAVADLGVPARIIPAKEGPGLTLLRELTPEVRQSLLRGTRGHCLATGRTLLQGGRSQLNLRLGDDSIPYVYLDAQGQLRTEIVGAKEKVTVSTTPANDRYGGQAGLNLRFQVNVCRAVGRSPVEGLPDLADGPPILREQQTDLTMQLAPDDEVLLLLGADRDKTRTGLLLRLSDPRQPAYTVPAQAVLLIPTQGQRLAVQGAAAEAGPPLTVPDHLPDVLAKVLPAVVKINIEQPVNQPGIRQQFQNFFLNPGEDGALRFRFEGPGQQQQFELQLPPGQNWQQWLQQNPQWQNWLQQFLKQNPDQNWNWFDFFQNNAHAADENRPRVLQVQPPDDEAKPELPGPPPLPQQPDLRLQLPFLNIPPQGRQRGFGQALFAGEMAGCIIRPEGYIVTMPGTMLQGAEGIRVTIHDGQVFTAQLVRVDNLSDVAVLKIEAENLPTVQFGDSDQVQIGEGIFSIGHPYGYVNTVSRGILSGRNRTLQQPRQPPVRGLFQVDTALAPGSSGGPVINDQGEVIGLNYAAFRPADNGAPLSFALPSNTVSWVATELIEKGQVERAWLGVALREVDEDKRAALNLPEAGGALVQEVMKGSPAEAAGLEIFDVIQRVGDQPIRTANDLVDAIQAMRPGEEVELGVRRNGEEKVLTLNLGKLPPPEELPQVQIQIAPPDEAAGPVPPPPRRRIPQRLKVEVQEGRVQLEATNVPLQAVIRSLAAATKAKIAVDPAVADQRITAQIDQPLDEALKELTEPHGLVVEQAGEWQIIRPK